MNTNMEFQQNMDKLLEIISSKPSNTAIVFSLLSAVLLSIIMWVAYRAAHNRSTYQPEFATTLVSLAFISTILMNLIQSNLALSLGMLGSLSIVRFRTNIRDPRDIGFIFWSMAIGIAAATGSHLIGLVGSLVLGLVMAFSKRLNELINPMILVIRGSNTDIESIQKTMDGEVVSSSVKAKNIMVDSYELVYEVQIQRSSENGLIEKLFNLNGIDSVNLLSVSAKEI